MPATNNRRSSHAAPSGSARTPRASRQAAPELVPGDKIQTIRAGQGARVTNRNNAEQAAARARRSAESRYLKRHPEARQPSGGPERTNKNVIALVVGALLALIVVFLLGRCVMTAFIGDDGSADQKQDGQTQDINTGTPDELKDATQEQVGVDGSVSYQGITYTLQQQESGRMGVVSMSQDGSSSVIFELEGSPVCLARFESVLVLPEDRDGGWDIVFFSIGGHSDPGYITDENGEKVTGSGTIHSVTLDGSVLHVTSADGTVQDVSLV